MNQLELPELYRDQLGILHVEVAAQFGTGNLKSEPSVKKKYKWAGREHSERGYTLNNYGFRDRDWTIAPQQGRRVMFVGDSFVEGFGLGDDGTIPVRFAACAEAAREQLEVMSFGVGAADIPHYQALIHDAVPLFRPSSVILVIYANDLPGPPFDERWLESPLAARRSMLLLPRAVVGEAYHQHARALSAGCNEGDIPFLDLTPGLRAVKADNRRLFWEYDVHSNPLGAERAAKRICDWWMTRN